MKLVVFDCDGTLVDSQHMICAAMQQTYDRHGLVCPPRETVLSIVGLSLQEAFVTLAAGNAAHPIDALVESYKSAFQSLRRDNTHHEPLYPGARDAVAPLAVRDDVLLGVATGKSVRGVKLVLGHHGLYDRFVTVQTADTAPSKPDPAMLHQAMREAGVAPGDTVMIGDTVFDIAMARAAGVVAIGVSWGYHAAADLRAAGADVVVDDFAQLLPALETRWSLPSTHTRGEVKEANHA